MKNKTLRIVCFVAILLAVGVAILGLNIHAHAAAPATTSKSTATAHVSILRLKGGAAFGKTTLSITHGTPFQFQNRTKIIQTVTSGGKTVATVPAKGTAPYTFAKAGTYTFGLASNSAATLTVTVK